jgi:hypothetical protein
LIVDARALAGVIQSHFIGRSINDAMHRSLAFFFAPRLDDHERSSTRPAPVAQHPNEGPMKARSRCPIDRKAVWRPPRPALVGGIGTRQDTTSRGSLELV